MDSNKNEKLKKKKKIQSQKGKKCPGQFPGCLAATQGFAAWIGHVGKIREDI